MNRRAAVASAAAALAGGAVGAAWLGRRANDTPRSISPESRLLKLRAEPAELELGRGLRASAWTYNGSMPGPLLRFREGERVRIEVHNSLPVATSIHWHGIPQRGTNNMDGVPGVTQDAVQPGDSFIYEFTAEPAGTFLFHSHFGLQIEHGLYGGLIVEPSRETLSYDRDHVVILDDWPARSPEAMMAELLSGAAMGRMSSMMRGPIRGAAVEASSMVRGIPESATAAAESPQVSAVQPATMTSVELEPDIAYGTFLINGRAPSDPVRFDTRRGDMIRFRFINAGASTAFRVSLGGHRMQVTHCDGFPCKPVDVDAFEISVGERYDVLVRADSPGIWPIVAASVDEPARGAKATLSYLDARGSSVAPSSSAKPGTSGRILTYGDLRASEPGKWESQPHRVLDTPLAGQMSPYEWSIGGMRSYGRAVPSYGVQHGDVVHIRVRNDSPMRHPMHLHGHSFRLLTGKNGDHVLKDTATVNPGGEIEFQFNADNPGNWLYHCHHAYHQEAGMMRVVRYL